MLRKEQTDLVNRNAALEAANHELSQKVNDSNWQSVKKMRDERDKAKELAHKTEVDCTRKIKEAQEQSRRSVRIAEREQHDAEKEARKAKAELKNRSALYIGIWFLTLLCNAVISPQIQSDAVDLFTSIADWLSAFCTDFGSWLVMPYYTDNDRHVYFHDWTGWAVRILAVILLIAVIAGVGILIIKIIKRYRQRWCNLTLKYLALMLAIMIIFAEPIRSVIPINLIILFLLSQIVYLPVLRYIDGCFESRQRSDFWEEFQNK